MLSSHADTYELPLSLNGASPDLALEEALLLVPSIGNSVPDAAGEDFRCIEVERDHFSITENFLPDADSAQRMCEDFARKAKACTFAFVHRIQGSPVWCAIVVRLR